MRGGEQEQPDDDEEDQEGTEGSTQRVGQERHGLIVPPPTPFRNLSATRSVVDAVPKKLSSQSPPLCIHRTLSERIGAARLKPQMVQ